MEAQQVSEAESAREQLQDLQDQIAGQKVSKQELETELDRMKQVSVWDERTHPLAVTWESSQESLEQGPYTLCFLLNRWKVEAQNGDKTCLIL